MRKIKRIILALNKMYRNAVKKDKKLIMMVIVYMFSSCIFDVLLAFFPKILLDMYINAYSIKKMSIFIIVFLISGCFSGMITNVIKQISVAKIGYLRIDYLADAFHKIITSEYKYMEDSTFFNKYDSAFDACSNAENGIEKVYNILFDIPALVIKIIVFAVVLCRFSLLVVIMAGVHALVSFLLKKKSAMYKYSYREEFSKINRKKRYYNNISQDFQYGKDIRLYHFRDIINEKYGNEIKKYKELSGKVKNKETLLNQAMGITMVLSDIVIYGTIILNSINGITISDVTMYFILVNMFMASVNYLIVCISGIYGEGLFIADYFDFIAADLGEDKESISDNIDKMETDIKIRNLCFKYPESNVYVFKNLNLDIKSGEKIALVGDNGVGKSTLIKILSGLFREYEGEIYIGGRSIRDISTKSLYKMFSVVFQDINLLAYTVGENITGSSEKSDEKKVWSALERAGVKEKISHTEKGLNQLVHKYMDEKGLEFSGGEIQKLAIARALYKDAPFYILDEPTASLDALAEKEIYEKFEKITDNKTTVFISHRLASTKFCDRIVLLGPDGVLEQGTHEELMKMNGKYFEMFSIQGKYYQENENEENKVVC